MKMIIDLQKLDALIVEHTHPPVTSILRHQLSLVTEQAEAYQESSDKQDNTLSEQIKTINRLMEENTALKNEATKRNDDVWRELKEEEERQRQAINNSLLSQF